MKITRPLLVALALAAANVAAEPVVDEALVRAISAEMVEAFYQRDASIFDKYFYPGSKIVIDMDPEPGVGRMQVDYEEFKMLSELGMMAMRDAEILIDITNVSVDATKNEATIEETSTTVAEMMGTRISEVAVTETRYGLVDGEVKALSVDNVLVSVSAE